MKTVLVTGSKGALGQRVISRLEKTHRWQVIATQLQPSKNECLQLDVCNREQILSTLKSTQPDLVLHLAATFVNDFDQAYSVNVESARSLLDVIQELKLPTRVLLVGSAAEYGQVKTEENPIRENHILNPISIYGLTKAWQTQLAGLYASRGANVVIARIFNLEGPGISERLFIGRLQNQIDEVLANRKSVIELGPLSATRDYVTTDQAADQILAIAAYGKSGQVYHVASGTPVTMSELLNRYLKVHQLDRSIVHESPSLTNRVGYDIPAIYAHMEKTNQLMELWRSNVE